MSTSQSNQEGLLRGTFFASGMTDVSRMLHNATTNSSSVTGDDDHIHSSDGGFQRNNHFVLITSIVVILAAMAYVICICHMFWGFVCRRFFRNDVVVGEDQSAFVDEGRVLELNPQQRRAVLEAILAETSKAVTEDDVYNGKKKKKRKLTKSTDSDHTVDNDDDSSCVIPADVEIPFISTVGSDGSDSSSEDGHIPDPAIALVRCLSLDRGSIANNTSSPELPPSPIVTRTRSSSYDDAASPANSATKSSTSASTPTAANKAESHRDDSWDPTDDSSLLGAQPMSQSPSLGSSLNEERSVAGRPSALFASHRVCNDVSSQLAFPSLDMKPAARNADGDEEENNDGRDEECKVEVEQDSRPAEVTHAAVQARRESFAPSVTTTSDYTFDSQTEGIVCSICLCAYTEGDMVIAAKYCTHVFHKDCILEWLEKRDECPVCRVNMVTNRDINKVATSVVGDLAQIQRRPVPGLRTPGSISRMNYSNPAFNPSYAGFSGRNHPLAIRSSPPRTQNRDGRDPTQSGASGVLSPTSPSNESRSASSMTIRRVGSAPPLERRPRVRQDSGLRMFNTTL